MDYIIIVHDNFIYDDNISNEFKNNIDWGTLFVQANFRHEFQNKSFWETNAGVSSYKNSSKLSVFNYQMGLNSVNNDLVFKILILFGVSPSVILTLIVSIFLSSITKESENFLFLVLKQQRNLCNIFHT